MLDYLSNLTDWALADCACGHCVEKRLVPRVTFRDTRPFGSVVVVVGATWTTFIDMRELYILTRSPKLLGDYQLYAFSPPYEPTNNGPQPECPSSRTSSFLLQFQF